MKQHSLGERLRQQAHAAACVDGLPMTCPATGKHRHASRRCARRHLKGLRSCNHHRNLSVFRCGYCQGGWHVGHDHHKEP